jgi:phenylacetyl-CoA:acceptor oxidoreductase subunit 1
MARWGMVIDLRKCIGCRACEDICSEINTVLPERKWRRVFEETAKKGSGKRLFIPVSCMHCENPPCVEVCPAEATKQRPDGIVEIDYDRCMGCGACIVACPYGARSLAGAEIYSLGAATRKKANRESGLIGVCTKCDFCIERVDNGLARGLRPGTDFEATPMCVNCCISEALHFGDLEDPTSEVSKMISENNVTRFIEDLGTKPSVYYITESWVEDSLWKA